MPINIKIRKKGKIHTRGRDLDNLSNFLYLLCLPKIILSIPSKIFLSKAKVEIVMNNCWNVKANNFSDRHNRLVNSIHNRYVLFSIKYFDRRLFVKNQIDTTVLGVSIKFKNTKNCVHSTYLIFDILSKLNNFDKQFYRQQVMPRKH